MNDQNEEEYDDEWPDEEEKARLLTHSIITAAAPPPVDDIYEYWGDQPPQLSERCQWWLGYLAVNDTLSMRQLVDLTSSCANYTDSATELGVYLWEWHHVLYHVLGHRMDTQREREERAKQPPPPWLNMNPAGSPKMDLTGMTDGSIKLSGTVSEKPDWTTEELDDPEEGES